MLQNISQKFHNITRKKDIPVYRFTRKIIAKILCSSFVGFIIGKLYNNKIKNGNCTINTDCLTVTNSTKARIFWGVYETAEIDFVKKYLNSNYDVIELGSSIGVLASHVTKMLNDQKKIVCVEANPVLIDCLKENLKNNALKDNFIVENVAIDYQGNEKVQFSISNNSLDSHIGVNKNSTNIISVPTTTLSNIIAKYSISDYTLICDIEGAEKAIFDNDANALINCKQLHIEMQEDEIVNGTLIKIADVVNMLQSKYNFIRKDNFLGAYVFDKN